MGILDPPFFTRHFSPGFPGCGEWSAERRMTFFLRAYGCQMNMRDADSVVALLVRHGLTLSDTEDAADVVIVNTCSVRGKAEDKALGKLGLLVAGKRGRPGRLVGAMGCMVQRLQEKLFDRVPGLDFAVGTQRISRIPAIIDLVREDGGPVLEAAEGEDDVEALTGHAESGTSAFVNILFGCDRRCSYCIVPAVRGREWSRSGERVVSEVRQLAENGIREVTLLGQSVMSYGRRNAVWPGDYRSPRGYREPLPRLLEAVGAVDGIARVRFTSGHPSGVTPELVSAMRDLPEVCAHLHLPVQSGSDRILKLMRRGYAADDYRAAVGRLREAVPGVAVTTDVIVGFPGETVSEFEMTRVFMDEIGFDNAFVFKYSPRPGTEAAGMCDDVPPDEKMRRNQVLLAEQNARGLALNSRLVGTRQEVLVEGVSLRNAERWTGRNSGNKIVVFARAAGLVAGDLREVHIDRAMAQTLYGEICNHE